jgi:hypothetical protein
VRAGPLGAALAAALALWVAGCSSKPATCTDLVHHACEADGGPYCGASETCVPSGEAVDPCAPGATACCFALCRGGTLCDGDLTCVNASSGAKVCAQGRCNVPAQ